MANETKREDLPKLYFDECFTGWKWFPCDLGAGEYSDKSFELHERMFFLGCLPGADQPRLRPIQRRGGKHYALYVKPGPYCEAYLTAYADLLDRVSFEIVQQGEFNLLRLQTPWAMPAIGMLVGVPFENMNKISGE